jgi:hypothetical protein
MKKLLALALVLWSTSAFGQNPLVPATQLSMPIAGAIQSITRIIQGRSGVAIYVTSVLLAPAASSVVTFTAGTGTNCNANTVGVTGAMSFPGAQELAIGTGFGAIWVLPPGNDLCLTISGAAAPGSLSYSIQ